MSELDTEKKQDELVATLGEITVRAARKQSCKTKVKAAMGTGDVWQLLASTTIQWAPLAKVNSLGALCEHTENKQRVAILNCQEATCCSAHGCVRVNHCDGGLRVYLF